MKTYFNTTLLFLFIFSITGFAQINLEKGYFINNQGVKTECLIKNNDWRNNPVKFEYKIKEEDKSNIKTVELIKEFSVVGKFKFIRVTVDIDRSSSYIEDLSDKRQPQFKSEVFFLKELVSGEASLYQYVDNGLIRYFYSTNNSNIKQLVYKEYVDKYNFSKENNMFK